MKHKTGDGLLKQVIKAESEIDTLHAHLRAVVAQGQADPAWTGWIHAVEMLIPDSPPRLAELKEQLRGNHLGHLADRMDYLADTEEPPRA